MRYSSRLWQSRQCHILKDRLESSLISYSWILIVLIILFVFFHFSGLEFFRPLIGGFWISLIRTTIAYLIALFLATIVALVISLNSLLESILLPLLDVMQSFPSFALFPVLVMALNHFPESVIILVLVVTMIWPILFSIIAGLKNRREDIEEAARVFGAKGVKRLIYFVLPELLPSIITGSIVGWGEGWEFIIGAELLVRAPQGIGSYLGYLGSSGQTTSLAFGVTMLMLLLFILNKLIWLPLLSRATKYESE